MPNNILLETSVSLLAETGDNLVTDSVYTSFPYSGSVSIEPLSSASYLRHGSTVYAGTLSVTISASSTARKGNECYGNVAVSVTPSHVRSRLIARDGSQQLSFAPEGINNFDISMSADQSLSISVSSESMKVNSGVISYDGRLVMSFAHYIDGVIVTGDYVDPVVVAGCPFCGTMLYDS